MTEIYKRLARLEIPSGVGVMDVQGAVDHLDVGIVLIDEEDLVSDGVKRLIENGSITARFERKLLLEEVLPQTTTPASLVRVIEARLSSLAPRDSLTVVDRYFFPTQAPSDYTSLIISLLAPIAQQVSRITVVTGKLYDAKMLAAVNSGLILAGANSGSPVTHHVSEDFHDRFWIADESRGFVVGTSLNGLGRRYALVDALKDQDTVEIVSALRARHLI